MHISTLVLCFFLKDLIVCFELLNEHILDCLLLELFAFLQLYSKILQASYCIISVCVLVDETRNTWLRNINISKLIFKAKPRKPVFLFGDNSASQQHTLKIKDFFNCLGHADF